MIVSCVAGFASIQDQEQPIRILSAFFHTGKMPHAMLFTGVDGIGKRSAATAFAMACNCTGDKVSIEAESSCTGSMPGNAAKVPAVCGRCRSCRKIQADSHPDIIRIEPAGQYIRIAQIRELLGTLAMKPYEAKLRVVIISDAHAMNPEAGNALLKILEEPPESTILILTASGTADLLPTIVSRCQQIRFNPLPLKRLAALLVEKEGVTPENARVLAAMADGSYSRALRLYRQGWIERRRWLMDAGGFLMGASPGRVTMTGLMALALELLEKKNGIGDALEILTSFYRDLAVLKFRRGRIINEDLSDRLHAAAGALSGTSLVANLEAIETTRKQLRGNANPRLAIELLLMQLTDHLPSISGRAGSV
ncbi:MAG: DNA polymerase III subunit delta' [Pseudomonadota bacterium]